MIDKVLGTPGAPDVSGFARIHRSILVNATLVKNLRCYDGHLYAADDGGSEHPAGRAARRLAERYCRQVISLTPLPSGTGQICHRAESSRAEVAVKLWVSIFQRTDNSLKMVGLGGLEPPTSPLSG